MFNLNRFNKESLSIIYKLVENGYDIDDCLIFNQEQLEELEYGLNSNLDISLYFNSRIIAEGMRYIREGIIMGIDVSLYNNPSFTQGKMKEIRDSIVNKTYMPIFSSDRINEQVIRNCSIMILEGFDKDFVNFLAENYCAERISKIRNFNIVYGDKFNDLFKEYCLSLKTLNELITISKNNFSLISKELFSLLKEVEREDNKKFKKITTLILNNISFDKCKDYLYGKIDFEELLKEEKIDYATELLKFKMKKSLGDDFEDNYSQNDISNFVELIKMDIDIDSLIRKYSNEQIEEILYTIEDCGKKSISQINNSMSPLEIYKFRNNHMFIENYRRTCQKLSMKKDFQNEVLERINIDFSTRGKWVLSIDNIKILESINIKDIIDKQKPIISLIKEGLTGEEVLINLEEE